MLFIEYPQCSTCQRAKKWLDERGIQYTDRHIKEQNPTYEELKEWQAQSGLPLKRFFNTSGLLYKSMQLKDKLPQMSSPPPMWAAASRSASGRLADAETCAKYGRAASASSSAGMARGVLGATVYTRRT